MPSGQSSAAGLLVARGQLRDMQSRMQDRDIATTTEAAQGGTRGSVLRWLGRGMLPPQLLSSRLLLQGWNLMVLRGSDTYPVGQRGSLQLAPRAWAPPAVPAP